MVAQNPLDIAVFVLNAVGGLLLSALLATISLSERLNPRDPVFSNFLFTWIMASALGSFYELVILANQNDLGLSASVLESVLTSITMVSTLNLSIHVWFVMRSGTRPVLRRSKKLRAFMLVVSPYVCGLFAIPSLFSEDIGDFIVSIFWLLISLVTPIFDLVLLFYYWRFLRKTRLTSANEVMSLPFLLRLLVFGVYRLLYTVLLVLDILSEFRSGNESWGIAFSVVQNSFPLLAFCVLGLRTDILQLWCPCIWGRKQSTPEDSEAPTRSSDIELSPTLNGSDRTAVMHHLTKDEEIHQYRY